LVQETGLIEMGEEEYDKEDDLQALLADYPKLLAGEQMTPDAPRRWLLIKREMLVPDEEDTSGRWSVDHLFIDQEAVPTLVEVKRSSDTRLRREVVGQMLDYAANAVTYWPSDRLELEFERTCLEQEVEPLDRLSGFLGDKSDPDAFWNIAQRNLQAGRIRMVFVADVIPTELRQIVRFLQTQLNPAEVYAVEVPQYTGSGRTALVPRLVTEPAPGQRIRWNEEGFFEAISDWDPDSQAAARQMLKWAAEQGLRVRWGTGKSPTFGPKLDHADTTYNMFNVYTSGRVEIPFGAMHGRYDNENAKEELRETLNSIDLVLPPDSIDRYPSIQMSSLLADNKLDRFLRVWEDQIRLILENDDSEV
jgi:hypothetical protein